jgi:hypothetical protein
MDNSQAVFICKGNKFGHESQNEDEGGNNPFGGSMI